MPEPGHDAFDDVPLEELRRRRSAKWATYPEDVLPAWVAEMDFPLAAPVRSALREAVERDDCGYPQPEPLFPAFAELAAERFGWTVDPGRMWVVPDVMGGVAGLVGALTAPGDGVAITPPVYPPFFGAVREAGRRVVEAPLAVRDGRYELDLEALERAFADATAFLLCNPHNPTGRVFTREELEAVAALADRHGVVVISDEIHAPLVLAGAVHVPYPTAGEAAAAHGLVLQSASKAWNVAGLKCAVVVACSDEAAELAGRLPASLRFHTGHFGVLASVAAFREGAGWLEAVRARLDANRRLLGTLLERELPEVGYTRPEAGYLAWLDCRALGLGDDPADAFLERGRVALSHGPTFGTQGGGFARLNFATSAALLEEAVVRMARAARI